MDPLTVRGGGGASLDDDTSIAYSPYHVNRFGLEFLRIVKNTFRRAERPASRIDRFRIVITHSPLRIVITHSDPDNPEQDRQQPEEVRAPIRRANTMGGAAKFLGGWAVWAARHVFSMGGSTILGVNAQRGAPQRIYGRRWP